MNEKIYNKLISHITLWCRTSQLLITSGTLILQLLAHTRTYMPQKNEH